MNELIKPVSRKYKQWDEKVAQSGNWKDHRGDVYNTCVSTKGKGHSCVVAVKHTLWWKIGTLLSYIIFICMAIYMLIKE